MVSPIKLTFLNGGLKDRKMLIGGLCGILALAYIGTQRPVFAHIRERLHHCNEEAHDHSA